MEDTINDITKTGNATGNFLSNFSLGGPKFTMAHLAVEVVVIGGISYYFSKRINKLQSTIETLQNKIKEFETTLKNSNCSETKTDECMEAVNDLQLNTKKHMTNIYQTLRKLSENVQTLNYKIEELQHEEEEEVVQPPPSLKQRKKFTVRELPVEEDEQFTTPPTPRVNIQPPPVLPQMFVHLQKVVQTGSVTKLPQTTNEEVYVQPTKPVTVEEVEVDDSELDKELEEQGIFLKEDTPQSPLQPTPIPQPEPREELHLETTEEPEVIQPYVPPEKVKTVKKKVKKEKN